MPTTETMADVQSRRVRVEFRDDFAVLWIDNPPVNVGSQAVRQGLIEALNKAKARNVAGTVLIGAGKCFIAGSDLRRGKGRPNIQEAVALVRGAGTGSARHWLATERATFHRLRVAPDAVALRYLFFAERRAASPGSTARPARRLDRIGIVGGGTMGQGIARAALSSGFKVVLVERLDDQRQRCEQAIRDQWACQVDTDRLSQENADARAAALTVSEETVDLKDCTLVIEAVFEDMQVKREVLSAIEAVLPPDVVVATNTSYLDIDEMARGLAHPERVLGLHFFSPADVMSLLEIVPAAATGDEAVATGFALARRLSKQPVVARVSEGFIGNRIYAAYRRRAELLVLDGAAPQDVDAAMRAYGFAMGPFEVADLSGLDIAWAMRRRQAATRDPAARYVTIPDGLYEAGRLGRKTGAGWYDYSQGAARPDPAVADIIEAARAEAGITPKGFTPDEITRQLLAVIINEGSCVIAEGVAREASDIDVVWANGYGFPRWRGGPLYWAKQQRRTPLMTADLSELSKAVGHGFRIGPVAEVLDGLRTGSVDGSPQQ